MAGRDLRIKGACVGKAGDWAWLKQVLDLHGWNGGPAHRCCWLCTATFTAGSYGEAGFNAEWRQTPVTTAHWWKSQVEEGRFCNAFWSIPGMHISCIRPDFMHVVDLGITCYLNGNLCWFLYILAWVEDGTVR